jgi:predicted SAM-dependent methyltransferase
MFKKVKKFFKKFSLSTRNNSFLQPIGIKIHFGCGNVNLPGWINIDALSSPHIHIVGSIEALKTFSQNSVDLIYACHVLEHLSVTECKRFIDIAYNILKSGGTLLLSVPDFRSLVNLYIETDNLIDIHPAIFGGQDYEFNFHKQGFDRLKISNDLSKTGFHSIENWSSLEEFGCEGFDWSSKKISISGKEYFISLNIKAMK